MCVCECFCVWRSKVTPGYLLCSRRWETPRTFWHARRLSFQHSHLSVQLQGSKVRSQSGLGGSQSCWWPAAARESKRERKTGRLEKRNVSVWMGKSLHGRFRSALKLHRGITISCQVQQAKTNVLALWCGTDSALNSVRSLTVQYLI